MPEFPYSDRTYHCGDLVKRLSVSIALGVSGKGRLSVSARSSPSFCAIQSNLPGVERFSLDSIENRSPDGFHRFKQGPRTLE
jgi:hypothetical protein